MQFEMQDNWSEAKNAVLELESHCSQKPEELQLKQFNVEHNL